MTEEHDKPKGAEPAPELPASGANLEPRSQPLAYDEPVEAHTEVPAGSAERAIEGDAAEGRHAAAGHAAADDHASRVQPGDHFDEHDSAHGHAHEEPRVGPIDWSAWSYTLVGAAVAVVLIAAFWVAAY
ncbi:MAG TPA: hypothetical protein VNT28_04115 [Candidatus Limnocylindrales bacterium]|nr:hypothetical protein [Candidatus Limnocylindrales bacterium]